MKAEADFQRIIGKHLSDDSSVATQNSHRQEVTKSYMFRHCIQRSKLQELLLSAGAVTYAKMSAVSCQVTPLTLSRLRT